MVRVGCVPVFLVGALFKNVRRHKKGSCLQFKGRLSRPLPKVFNWKSLSYMLWFGKKTIWTHWTQLVPTEYVLTPWFDSPLVEQLNSLTSTIGP